MKRLPALMAVLAWAGLMALGGCASPQAKPNTGERPAPAESSIEADVPWTTIGASVRGRPIRAADIGSGADRVYLIGSIHGDETQGLAGLPALIAHLRTTRHATVRVVEDMNPDGTVARRRTNSRGIDLNRNWPAHNFRTGSARGVRPLSEPETRAVHADLMSFAPDAVIVLHSTSRGPFVNYDGPASQLADAFASAARAHDDRWGVEPSMGYPTPGSLGTLIGIDAGVPILTIEFAQPYDPAIASSVLIDGVDAAIGSLTGSRRTAGSR